MAGTKEGGLTASETIKARYGDTFYSDLGKKGAEAYMAIPKEERKPRGFAANIERARAAGKIGGQRSRKPKSA